jgi:hypothetical protein
MIFHSVLEKDGKHEVHEDLKAAFADMPPFQPVNAKGLVQVIQYVCNNMAATASNNVWMHFKARVSKHVHSINAVPEAVYKAMSADEKRRRKLLQLWETFVQCGEKNSSWTHSIITNGSFYRENIWKLIKFSP